MLDLSPDADKLYREFLSTDPDTRSRLVAHSFLDWLGIRLGSAVTAGDAMEYLWGYVPLHWRTVEVPDDTRVSLGHFLKFLKASGFQTGESLKVAWDKRTFARRYKSYAGVPFTLWCEELRLGVVEAGFESTIPIMDADDLLGEREPGLFEGKAGLSIAATPQIDTAELLSDAAKAVTIQRVRSLIERFLKPRSLTAKGFIGLADAKSLAEEFGVSNLFDQRIGDKVFKPKSSVEIRPVHLAFIWARAGGFLRVSGGKAVATTRGKKLGANPLDDWWRLFSSFLLKVKWLAQRYPADRRPFWVNDAAGFSVSYLSHVARNRDRGMAIMTLAIKTWWEMERRFIIEDLTIEQRMNEASHIEASLRYGFFGPLADLGAVDLWMSGVSGATRITSLGLWGLHKLKKESFSTDDGADIIELFGPR